VHRNQQQQRRGHRTSFISLLLLTGGAAIDESIKSEAMFRPQGVIFTKLRENLPGEGLDAPLPRWPWFPEGEGAARRVAVGSTPPRHGASFAGRRQRFLGGGRDPPLLVDIIVAEGIHVNPNGEGEGESAAPPLEKPENLVHRLFLASERVRKWRVHEATASTMFHGARELFVRE